MKPATLFALLCALTAAISILVRPDPIAEPIAPPAVSTCADSVALVALLNAQRVGLGDGSYATCRVHHLPKGEHINEAL